MANRPIYIPNKGNNAPSVTKEDVDFDWHPGMAKVQKQKSIDSLHEAAYASDLGCKNILEISSKSKIPLGNKLSAFELLITTKKGKQFSVECAFQSSKKFEHGGPFTELLDRTSKEAKTDIRLKESGNLTEFIFYNKHYSLEPTTFFYDWLYISALHQNIELARDVLAYDGFTDIEFNPKKSWNSQANAAALYVSIHSVDETALERVSQDPEYFKALVEAEYREKDEQRLGNNQLSLIS